MSAIELKHSEDTAYYMRQCFETTVAIPVNTMVDNDGMYNVLNIGVVVFEYPVLECSTFFSDLV